MKREGKKERKKKTKKHDPRPKRTKERTKKHDPRPKIAKARVHVFASRGMKTARTMFALDEASARGKGRRGKKQTREREG